MGAARVPRRSFKTAYTSKKTKTMSATLRGSTSRLRYSVYGSSSNISAVQNCKPAVLGVATATSFLQTYSTFNEACRIMAKKIGAGNGGKPSTDYADFFHSISEICG